MVAEIAMATTTRKKKMGRPKLGMESDFRRFGGNPKPGLNGWLIYDAKKQLLLPINHTHVLRAKPRVGSECVVAIATSDFFADKYAVEVKLTVVHVADEENKKLLRFYLPAALRQKLCMFDRKNVWSAPFGLYSLYPMKKKATKKKIVKFAAKNSSGKTIISPRPTTKRKKKVFNPSRVVSRGKIYKRLRKSLVR